MRPTSAGTLLLAALLVSAPAARAYAVHGRASQAQPCAIAADGRLTLIFVYGAGLPGCGDYADNNGNIREQEIEALVAGQPAFSQTYDYDNVNRLLSVSEDLTSWSRVYSYDAYGNRALTGIGAGAAVGIQQPQALSDFEPTNNRLKTAWADYDPAGNLDHFKYPGNAAFDWRAAYDALNKQRWFCKNESVDCGFANADAEYRYDGQGNRVQKILDPAGANPTTITYVYDAFGKLAAEYSTAPPTGEGGTFYRTTDHLGSTRLVTRADGSCKGWQDFYPFGERILGNASTGRENWACYGGAGTDPFEQEFTGKERDDESNLDYFGARYFSASLGRFTGPDEPLFDQFPGNPQSWNLYGYSRNNPLRFFDPTGRKCVTVTDGDGNSSQADDGTGGGCAEAGVGEDGSIQAQQVDVSGQRGSIGGALLAGGFIGLSNAASNYFGFIFERRPATLQPIDPGTDSTVTTAAVVAPFLVPGPKGGKATKLLGAGRPILTQEALEHIVLRHWPTSGATGAGKFGAGTTARSLKGLIEEAVANGASRANTRGRPGTIVEHTFGRQIGVDSAGRASSRIRVVLNPDNSVKTAFPVN